MIKSKLLSFLRSYWHILLLVAISLIPIIWFFGKGDAIINGVDTNFPLNPKIWLFRRFFMWNNLGNGGSDFSFAPAGIFFHIIQFLPYIAGLSLQAVEKMSMVFWFGLIVFSSYIFVGNFIKENRLLKILFVTLYALNIYMFNSWENVKVANLSLVASIPLLLHVFVNLNEKTITKAKAGLLLAFISLILSGAGINPAYFISAMMCLFVFAISTIIVEKNAKDVFKTVIFMIAVITVVSSYWIIPTVSFVLRTVSQSSSIGSIGFNNWIDSLSENTSIMNVLRLQGAWDWYSFDKMSKTPLFLPYTPNYFLRFPFVFFSFVVPSISLLSLVYLNNRKNKYYLAFLLMMLCGLFLGAGSHKPTGDVFVWLTEHLPYFSLFRSPWYIFTPLLTLSLSGLVTLFFDRLKDVKHINIFVYIIIASNIVYCYPLVTGRIFRPSRSDGFYVNFPDYVFEAGNRLGETVQDRVITYPDDQLEKFTWGYIGVEPVINLFVDREMIFPAINNTESPFSRIVSEFYEKIKIHNYDAVGNILAKLGANTLLEKRDQITLAPALSNGLLEVNRFGNWVIRMVDDKDKTVGKISLANNFYYSYSPKFVDQISQVGFVKKDEHLINPNDSVIEKISYFRSNGGNIVSASNSQSESYYKGKPREMDPAHVNYSFTIPEDGLYMPVIESYGLDESDLNTFTLKDRDNFLKLHLQYFDDSYAYFDEIFLEKGEYSYTYAVSNHKTYFNNFDSIGGQLRLLNIGNEDLNYEIKIPNFDYNRKYFIMFDYKWNKGNKPLVLIEQRSEKTLFKTEAIGLEGENAFSTYKFFYTPVQTNSETKLTFVAPKTMSDRGTLVDYDNLYIYQVFTNRLYLTKKSKTDGILANLEFHNNSPVKYSGTVRGFKNPQTIIFAENYSPDWRIKITDLDGNKIRYRADHFTVDLYANAWYVDTVGEDFNFEIYYEPQKYFNIGLITSLISVAGILVFYAYSRYKNDR